MNFIKGYKPTEYQTLQKDLSEAFRVSGKSLIDLAAEAGVTTTNTIHSTINSDNQVVSDKVLTKVCESLNLGAFVLWINGEKHYYIKSNGTPKG